MKTRLQYTIGAIAFGFSVALAAPAVGLPSMTSASVESVEAAVKKPKVSKKVTIKKEKKKTVTVKNIRRIVKVKSSKKKIVTVKKKGKKVILKAKKKTGKATVKITVKDLRGKKKTLKMKVVVKKKIPNTSTKKNTGKVYRDKFGDRYITKWGFNEKQKMLIEDQHISVRLVSKSMNRSGSEWSLNIPTMPNKAGDYWYNTYTFNITNNRNYPITMLRRASDVGSIGYEMSDYYFFTLDKQYFYHDDDPDPRCDGVGLLSDGDVIINPGETKQITWTQPEAYSYSNGPGHENGVKNHWISLRYRDESGHTRMIYWDLSRNDFAFSTLL